MASNIVQSASRTSAERRDEERLAELGYDQKLRRDWGLLQNFGCSFSIISVITGITTLFATGLTLGGPGCMTVGWIVVSFCTMMVALGMAEIVSAVPTSGGPYYWAAVLSPPKYSAMVAWYTGWFNFLGQVAVTTGITFGCAGLIATLAAAHGFVPTPGNTIGIYAALLFSHGLVNTFGVHTLRYLNNSSIILHSLGVFALVVAVLAKAPTHQSAEFVFATFNDGTAAEEGAQGWSQRASPAYVAITGILLGQYTITGFDASAHLSEETQNAAVSAPRGVLISVGASAIFGFFVLVSFLFSIQDYQNTLDSPVGQPVLQILIDIFGLTGATVLMSLIIVCVWHCGLFSLTSNSRMMYAWARDRALPGWFDHVDPKFQSPWRTVWLGATLSFILALPSLGSTVAFAAATSIATIGLYISYVIPIACGVIWHSSFTKGPFHLGKLSRPIGIAAVAWVSFITIVFCLPTANPVSSETLNYTPVAVGIVFLGCVISWYGFANRYFTGPIRQIDLKHVGGVRGEAESEGQIGEKEELDQGSLEKGKSGI